MVKLNLAALTTLCCIFLLNVIEEGTRVNARDCGRRWIGLALGRCHLVETPLELLYIEVVAIMALVDKVLRRISTIKGCL